MMAKIIRWVFVLAMLAILFYPAWYLWKHPDFLTPPPVPTLSAGGEINLPMLATVAAPAVLATSTSVHDAGNPPALAVVITAESVNLRYISNGVASGFYLYKGDLVMVVWREDNYGVIISPQNLTDFMIWRGCTSDAGNLGCEPK